MKAMAAFLVLACVAPALAVQVGDARASVLAELGEPMNKMSAGTREFLNYPHGRVTITDGKVSDLRGTLPSPVAVPAAAADLSPSPAPPKPAATAGATRQRTAQWYTEIARAQSAAAKEHKLILALFTGTDWCPPCQQFKAEVENDEQFASIFAGSFIFLKSDWLRNTPQPEAVMDEVRALKIKYLVTSYPTLLVLNAEGEKLAKVDWTKPREGSFKEVMIEAIDEARKATKGGKKASGGWWPF